MRTIEENLKIFKKELCDECPDRPMGKCLCGCMRKVIMNKLYEWGEYKQAERDGRLVVLPCEVGGKAVMVFDESGELFITDGWAAENILITENETVYNFYCSLTNEYERRNSDDFGKTVFLTKEAAEQALKGGAE